MSGHENYRQVLAQMEHYGVVFRPKDKDKFPVLGERSTCGVGGKYWYKLHTFTTDAGDRYLVGGFGSYKAKDFVKVEVDYKPLTEEQKARYRAEREAERAKADAQRKAANEVAALGAWDLWRRASPSGFSPYLVRKGLEGESCRYLPDGTLVVPMIRYDLPKAEALQAVQRVLPDGRKFFTAGFSKPRCAVRLGEVSDPPRLLLACEGYATGLSIRLGLEREFPVFVAFDAGNLAHVVPMLRELYPLVRLLICADDDWKTFDHLTGRLSNPGRNVGRKVAREVAGCDYVWPVFDPSRRQEKDTDFDDLRQREGLEVVRRQLRGVIEAMGKVYG